MMRHSEVKYFNCDDCRKQLPRKDKLREHVQRLHSTTGVGRGLCMGEDCGKQFLRKE